MATNPWLPTAPEAAPEPSDSSATPLLVPPTGATGPQPAVPGVDRADRLEEFSPHDAAPLWVVGAHGGAGESTVATLIGGTAASHRWPRQSPPARVVLTARTSLTGLLRAQLAMRSWAAGQTPEIRMVGLVLVADAQGRLPKSLTHLAHTIGGGVPHVWRLPWIEDLRVQPVEDHHPSRQTAKVLSEISTVLKST